MRKVTLPSASETVADVRRNIYEAILSQMHHAGSIDYQGNKYLKRLSDMSDLQELIKTSLAGIDSDRWHVLHHRYWSQAKSLNDPQIKITYSDLDQCIRKFSDLIYDQCLFGRRFWKEFGKQYVSKTEYKEAFFLKNGWWICPFCDLTKDPESRSFEIDHYFPKSRFPLVSIHERNLIPICKSCNNIHYGKGVEYLNDSFNLFEEQIGDHVKYHFDGPGLYTIHSQITSASKFVAMIKLNQRLKKAGPKREIENLLKKAIKAQKHHYSLDQFRDIHDNLYFASKDAYEFAGRIVK